MFALSSLEPEPPGNHFHYGRYQDHSNICTAAGTQAVESNRFGVAAGDSAHRWLVLLGLASLHHQLTTTLKGFGHALAIEYLHHTA